MRLREFLNSDGTPASWLEPLSTEQRRKALSWRVASGVAAAAVVWGLQIGNHAFDSDRAWVGLIPLCLGFLFGHSAYKQTAIRRYSAALVIFTRKQRLLRAAGFWAFGAIGLAIAWSAQISAGHFPEYWWYVWPILLPLFVGTGKYMIRTQNVLTPKASEAKAHFDASTQANELRATEPSVIERVLSTPWFRYVTAAALVGGAYYFAAISAAKSGWAGAILCFVLAVLFAYEISIAVLSVALIVAIGWALFAGISALPVSVAVVLGALIIAIAISR